MFAEALVEIRVRLAVLDTRLPLRRAAVVCFRTGDLVRKRATIALEEEGLLTPVTSGSQPVRTTCGGLV